MHIFVRNLASRSRQYEVDELATVLELKQLIQDGEGVPASCQQLVFSGRQLADDSRALSTWGISTDNTVHLTLGLRGGKGGFGALLRGQGRDGKVTTNFDACRDLQGRRIKHTTVEIKLQDWKAEQKEREMEKVALKHLKEQARKERAEAANQVDVESVVQAQQETVKDVRDAVQDALAASSSSPAKKRALDEQMQKAGKKSKMMELHGLSSDDEDSSDEDDA